MSTIFMVWVEGRRQPRKRHETMESAVEEAKRLSHLPEIQHKRIFVLVLVNGFRLRKRKKSLL